MKRIMGLGVEPMTEYGKKMKKEPHIFCPKKIMYSSPEVLVGKCMARAGFEVALKFKNALTQRLDRNDF